MNWPFHPFESLFEEPTRNGVYKPAPFHGSGVKIVNMGELFGYGFIGSQPMSRLQLDSQELLRSQLNDGDLLFGRRSLVESGAGKCSIVLGLAEPTTFESSLIRVRLSSNVAAPLFYYYWFQSPQGRGSIRAIVSGTNVKGIRSSDLKNVRVPIPEPHIQKHIAAVLNAYDTLIENNHRRIDLLEESARLLYQEWFVRLHFPGHDRTRVIDSIPEGWQRRALGDLANVVMGQSPESKHYNDTMVGLPFHQGVSDFGDRFVEHRVYCSEFTRLAQAGDILCSVRAPVGRLNVTLDPIVIGRGLCAISGRNLPQAFLFQQLRAHFIREDMIGTGSIFASVGKRELLGQQLLTPSSNLVEAFSQVCEPIDKQIKALTLQARKLALARDLLLPKLMSGQVRV